LGWGWVRVDAEEEEEEEEVVEEEVEWRWYLALVAHALDRLGEQHHHCHGGGEAGEGESGEGEGGEERAAGARAVEAHATSAGQWCRAAVVAPSFFTAAFLAIMTAVPLGSSSAPPRANGGRRSAPHAQASRKKLTRMLSEVVTVGQRNQGKFDARGAPTDARAD